MPEGPAGAGNLAHLDGRGSGATVVVAVDASFVRMRLRRLVEGLGFDALETANGKGAMRRCREYIPRLLCWTSPC